MPFAKGSELARLALVAVQYREQVGEALRERRKALGLTQSQVADRVERYLREHDKREEGKPFDPQNVSRWERGKNLGKTDNLEAVAWALETTVPELMASIKPEPEKRRALNGNQPDEPPYVQELRDELQTVKRMLEELGRGVEATSEAFEANLEPFATKLEELLRAVAQLRRPAA